MTQSMTLPIIWLLVVLAAIFFEAIFENLVVVWLAPSATVAFIGGMFSMSPRGQIIIFAVTSFALIVASGLIRLLYRRYAKHNRSGENIE